MTKSFLPLLLCCLISTSFLTDTPQTTVRQGKDYALFFAVNDYENDRLRDLTNPINNATEIAGVLEEHYGYETEVVKNPTLNKIVDKLSEYQSKFAKNPNGTYPSSGQLMIFFTGHGEELNRNGYFLPADADPQRLFQTGFAYSIWRPFIDEIQCDHIMVAIDACYSGVFDPGWYSMNGGTMGTRPGELSESEKLIVEHEKYKTRWFFTSGTDIKTPDQSRFVSKFLEGLRSWGGNDGILTSSELWTYLDKASPRPHQNDFGKNEGGSSFLFLLENPLQNMVIPPDDTNQMEQDLAAWKTAKQRNTISAYQAYLEQFAAGEFRELAIAKIRKLEQTALMQREQVVWDIAKEKNTKAGYLNYKAEYPTGRFVNQANENIKQLEEVAKSPVFSNAALPDNMVFVKGGTFTMGCTSEQGEDCHDDEKPAHEVTVSDFYISKYEVTNQEFCKFLNEKGNQSEGGSEWLDIESSSCKIEKKGSGFQPKKGYGNHPVVKVSWYGAVAYCQWKGAKYRLSTEAEWEYAARGGIESKVYKYAGGNDIDRVGWNWNNSERSTHPVGEKQPNELGLYDMSGNVWEWCSDWYDKDYYKRSPKNNPKGADTGSNRVLRGGSWGNKPTGQRVADRSYYTPSNRRSHYGFRISRAAS